MLPAHKNIAITELTDPSSVFISTLSPMRRKLFVLVLNLLSIIISLIRKLLLLLNKGFLQFLCLPSFGDKLELFNYTVRSNFNGINNF